MTNDKMSEEDLVDLEEFQQMVGLNLNYIKQELSLPADRLIPVKQLKASIAKLLEDL